MPPKRQVVAAMERKAANEDAKQAKAAAQREAAEAEQWSKGAKGPNAKKEEEERKRLEALAKKAERDALLAAEEASIGGKKSSSTPSKSKSSKPTATFSGVDAALASLSTSSTDTVPTESYVATNIDDALQLLDITGGKSGGGGGAAAVAAGIERHPERRMKSAWAAFEEREMPILKEENPGLRLSQLKQLLQKKWKKSPENPLNWESNVSYNATQQDVKAQVDDTKEKALERMREK
ncbi:hypothetical protein DFJ73DRAFT_870159 [Zopfochytrium polystomum]|nr:hypothetical protein DFJ73DRAFT_870159 [Zopfochytrium polystomum]